MCVIFLYKSVMTKMGTLIYNRGGSQIIQSYYLDAELEHAGQVGHL